MIKLIVVIFVACACVAQAQYVDEPIRGSVIDTSAKSIGVGESVRYVQTGGEAQQYQALPPRSYVAEPPQCSHAHGCGCEESQQVISLIQGVVAYKMIEEMNDRKIDIDINHRRGHVYPYRYTVSRDCGRDYRPRKTARISLGRYRHCR